MKFLQKLSFLVKLDQLMGIVFNLKIAVFGKTSIVRKVINIYKAGNTLAETNQQKSEKQKKNNPEKIKI